MYVRTFINKPCELGDMLEEAGLGRPFSEQGLEAVFDDLEARGTGELQLGTVPRAYGEEDVSAFCDDVDAADAAEFREAWGGPEGPGRSYERDLALAGWLAENGRTVGGRAPVRICGSEGTIVFRN